MNTLAMVIFQPFTFLNGPNIVLQDCTFVSDRIFFFYVGSDQEARNGAVLVVVIQNPDKSNSRKCFICLIVQGSSSS